MGQPGGVVPRPDYWYYRPTGLNAKSRCNAGSNPVSSNNLRVGSSTGRALAFKNKGQMMIKENTVQNFIIFEFALPILAERYGIDIDWLEEFFESNRDPDANDIAVLSEATQMSSEFWSGMSELVKIRRARVAALRA